MKTGRGSGACVASAAFMLLAIACGSDTTDESSAVCEKGKQDACTCPGGGIGAQVCDGTKWGPCECPDSGSSGAGGTSGSGGTSGTGGSGGGGSGGDAGSAGTGETAAGAGGGSGGVAGSAGSSGIGGAAGFGANGLDPLLVPADPYGQPCEVLLGYITDCYPFLACRFASPTEGRCEEFDGNCVPEGVCPPGTPCVDGSDCNPIHACYDGHCRRICDLADGCTDNETCKNVGHVTEGVCTP